jgi:hypothetical protein
MREHAFPVTGRPLQNDHRALVRLRLPGVFPCPYEGGEVIHQAAARSVRGEDRYRWQVAVDRRDGLASWRDMGGQVSPRYVHVHDIPGGGFARLAAGVLAELRRTGLVLAQATHRAAARGQRELTALRPGCGHRGLVHVHDKPVARRGERLQGVQPFGRLVRWLPHPLRPPGIPLPGRLGEAGKRAACVISPGSVQVEDHQRMRLGAATDAQEGAELNGQGHPREHQRQVKAGSRSLHRLLWAPDPL